MKNSEIIRKVEEIQSGNLDKDLQLTEKTYKLLVFHINQRKLAFYAEQVREILIDVPLFFIPFVPPYIRGFINRHGEPYTVVDMNILFEKEKLEAATYLILNLQDDQLAFLISDILEILKVPESRIHQITSTNEHEGYFRGSVSTDDGEIFILNLADILGRLDADIQGTGQGIG